MNSATSYTHLTIYVGGHSASELIRFVYYIIITTAAAGAKLGAAQITIITRSFWSYYNNILFVPIRRPHSKTRTSRDKDIINTHQAASRIIYYYKIIYIYALVNKITWRPVSPTYTMCAVAASASAAFILYIILCPPQPSFVFISLSARGRTYIHVSLSPLIF